MPTFKLGQSVLVNTFQRTDAIGRITRLNPSGTYEVRIPNWQADGVHLDVVCRADELETGHGRAPRCRCCYCP